MKLLPCTLIQEVPRRPLTREAAVAFKARVLSEYPKEACGLICSDDLFHPCKNAADDPLTTFEIDGRERFELEKTFGPALAVLHSHPYKLSDSQGFAKNHYHPAWASVTDQASFIKDCCSWGIVATDGEGISRYEWLEHSAQPLRGRMFSWFSADCYSCIRDWHRENGLYLPNFTREYEFWKKGQNTIEDGIKTLPHATIKRVSEAQVGDVAVFAIGGAVVNHLGVISGNNEMLHQFIDNYAQVARWDQWQRRAKYLVRFQ